MHQSNQIWTSIFIKDKKTTKMTIPTRKTTIILSSNKPGLSLMSVGAKQAKEEIKRPKIHGVINTFVLTMTGSPKSSHDDTQTPEQALFPPKMFSPALKTPKNVMGASCLLRKVFGGENGPHIVSPESPLSQHAII